MAEKEQKKRKRHSNGTDGPSKRVSFSGVNGPLKVSFANKDGLHPILVSAPGLSTPSIPFDPYVQQTAKKTNGFPSPHTHNVLLHSDQHPKLDYTATPVANDEPISHYVAVLDPKTNKVEVYPAYHTSLRRIPRRDEDEDKEENERTMLEQRAELGMEFGTKKAKKIIADKTVNAITKGSKGKGKQDDVADAILESIDAKSATDKKKEEIEAELLASKPIPKPNLTATSVEEVYAYKTLVPPAVAMLVSVKEWQRKALADEGIEFHHRFPAARVVSVVKSSDSNRLKALGYLACLLDFHDALIGAGRSGKKVPKPAILAEKVPHWKPELLTSIRNRFATPSHELPKWNMDNLYTHICAIALYVDGWVTDTTTLKDDLRLDAQQITAYFKELGCRLSKPTEREREAQGLTKTQADAMRVARLKLPLEFPKVRLSRKT